VETLAGVTGPVRPGHDQLEEAGPALFAVGFQINDPGTFQSQTLPHRPGGLMTTAQTEV
jgi:hypothetical protein